MSNDVVGHCATLLFDTFRLSYLQDFEQAYEMKFASKWINGSAPAVSQSNGHAEGHSQQVNGSVQNGHTNKDDEIFAELKKPSSSSAIYEQYLKKVTLSLSLCESLVVFSKFLWTEK